MHVIRQLSIVVILVALIVLGILYYALPKTPKRVSADSTAVESALCTVDSPCADSVQVVL